MDLPSAVHDHVDSKDFPSISPDASDNEQDLESDSIMIAADSHTRNGIGKPVSNAKDPNRPKRKKARRACYACQRAHLTCGMYLSCFSGFSI